MHSLDKTMEETFDNRSIKIEYAEKMQRLLENDDFKALFSELYVEGFAMTNISNLWMYDDQARRRFLEKSLARSVFLRFIDQTLEEGREAVLSMREEQEMDQESEELEAF
jgi:hypothetical protein